MAKTKKKGNKNMQNVTPNTRQWKLYQLVKERTANGLKTTIKDICDALPNYYSVKETRGNYSNCPLIYQDIDILNSIPKLELIVKNNNSFKIPNHDEALEYAVRLQTRAFRLLHKFWVVDEKIDLHGQGVFLDKDGNAITEQSKARDWVKSFIEDEEHD